VATAICNTEVLQNKYCRLFRVSVNKILIRQTNSSYLRLDIFQTNGVISSCRPQTCSVKSQCKL